MFTVRYTYNNRGEFAEFNDYAKAKAFAEDNSGYIVWCMSKAKQEDYE